MCTPACAAHSNRAWRASRKGVLGSGACAPEHLAACNHVAQLERLRVQQQQVGIGVGRQLRAGRHQSLAAHTRSL